MHFFLRTLHQWRLEEAVVTTLFVGAEVVFAGCVSTTDCEYPERPSISSKVRRSETAAEVSLLLHLYPVIVDASRASRAHRCSLALFLRFTMVKLMHAAISGSWRSLQASCADKHKRTDSGAHHPPSTASAEGLGAMIAIVLGAQTGTRLVVESGTPVLVRLEFRQCGLGTLFFAMASPVLVPYCFWSWSHLLGGAFMAAR